MADYQTTQKVFGPLVVYRLEGSIKGIKKVIYLFGEFHLINKKCDDSVSLEMYQYITREFKAIEKNNEKREYDFFLEMNPNPLSHEKGFTNSMVIKNLMNTFAKNIGLDDHYIVFSKIGKIRLHYIDFRMGIIYNIDNTFDSLTNMIHGCSTCTKNEFTFLIDNIMTLNRLLNTRTKPSIKITDVLKIKTPVIHGRPDVNMIKLSNELINGIVYKIRNEYKHPDIKGILTKYMSKVSDDNEHLENEMKKIQKEYNELTNDSY